MSGQTDITYYRVISDLTKGPYSAYTHASKHTHTLIESLWLALPTLALEREDLVGEPAHPHLLPFSLSFTPKAPRIAFWFVTDRVLRVVSFSIGLNPRTPSEEERNAQSGWKKRKSDLSLLKTIQILHQKKHWDHKSDFKDCSIFFPSIISPFRSSSEMLLHCYNMNDGVCISVTMTNDGFMFLLELVTQ